jgi:hypothetical protein
MKRRHHIHEDRRRRANLNPVGCVFYHASTFICTPASPSQEVALGLGAQAGEHRLSPFEDDIRRTSRSATPANALQKTTLAEMRAANVRGLLVYCSDYHCSH